jgi:hypothetical protein
MLLAVEMAWTLSFVSLRQVVKGTITVEFSRESPVARKSSYKTITFFLCYMSWFIKTLPSEFSPEYRYVWSDPFAAGLKTRWRTY